MATSNTETSVSGSHYGENQGTSSEDAIDQMVETASVPNLAALMKQAVERGLITPTKGYASA